MNRKKMMGLLLAASTLAASEGVFASTAEGNGTDSGTETLSFRVTTVNFGEVPTDKIVQQKWEEYCSKKMGKNLDITFEYINAADYKEKLQIMLAGGELPDILTLWGLNQTDIVKYGEAGLFEDLSQHLDQMPNYKAALEEAKSSQSKIYSDTGALYAVYNANVNAVDANGGIGVGSGTAVRLDLFKENNLDIPETVEDIYTAAKALKEVYPDKYPIMSMYDWGDPRGILTMAYHTGTDKYYDGEKFCYGPLDDNYKEVLQQMNRWYTEGLINPDLFVQTSDYANSVMANGDGMIIPNCWNGYPGQWEAQYPDQEWVMAPNIKSEKYENPWTFWLDATDNVGFIPNYSFVLNAKSEVKDELYAFMDMQFDDEVVALLNWGIEGESYTVDTDGLKHFTDEARDLTNDMANKYGYGDGKCRSGIFPQVTDQYARVDQSPEQNFYYKGEIIRSSVPAFGKNYNTADEMVPETLIEVTPLTAEESEEYADIMTPVQTYAEEQAVKFISGERSFDEWDEYVEELNMMGDIQKAMDIYTSHVVEKQ